MGVPMPRAKVLLSNIGKERMDVVVIPHPAEAMLDDEARGGEVTRKRIDDTLMLNRIGVAVMTALSLVALLMYLRSARALDVQRQRQQAAIQAERDHLEAEVARRTTELTVLSRHLLTAREDERARLARELHDELGALLTAAKLDVARIKTRIGVLSPEAGERLAHLAATSTAAFRSNAASSRTCGLRRSPTSASSPRCASRPRSSRNTASCASCAT